MNLDAIKEIILATEDLIKITDHGDGEIIVKLKRHFEDLDLEKYKEYFLEERDRLLVQHLRQGYHRDYLYLLNLCKAKSFTTNELVVFIFDSSLQKSFDNIIEMYSKQAHEYMVQKNKGVYVMLSDKILKLGPCHHAVEWLNKQPDWQTAWNVCEKASWMIWLLIRLEHITNRQLVYACFKIISSVSTENQAIYECLFAIEACCNAEIGYSLVLEKMKALDLNQIDDKTRFHNKAVYHLGRAIRSRYACADAVCYVLGYSITDKECCNIIREHFPHEPT